MKQESNYKKEMSDFQFKLMKGKIVEMIVQNILEHCGFKVYPFGHESTLGKLKEDFKDYKHHSETLQKIRFAPDFVLYDSEKEEAFLLEVKYRNSEKEEFQADYEKYKQFWPECAILLVNPSAPNKYYFQWLKNLEPSKKFYNRNLRKEQIFYNINDFMKLQEAIPMIGLKTVEKTFPILEALTKN